MKNISVVLNIYSQISIAYRYADSKTKISVFRKSPLKRIKKMNKERKSSLLTFKFLGADAGRTRSMG